MTTTLFSIQNFADRISAPTWDLDLLPQAKKELEDLQKQPHEPSVQRAIDHAWKIIQIKEVLFQKIHSIDLKIRIFQESLKSRPVLPIDQYLDTVQKIDRLQKEILSIDAPYFNKKHSRDEFLTAIEELKTAIVQIDPRKTVTKSSSWNFLNREIIIISVTCYCMFTDPRGPGYGLMTGLIGGGIALGAQKILEFSLLRLLRPTLR